jgi:hypothetical protein
MRVRRKHLVIVAGLVAAVMTMALVGRNREPNEPSYNGHSLSEWLHAARPGYHNPTAPPAEAKAAIDKIGTNAIPTLLKWTSYELPKLKAKLSPYFSTGDHFADAEEAFHILGPVAHPAIPELTRLAITSAGEDRVMRCSRCLAYIGPEAVPALAAIISDYHGKARYYPIAVLAHYQIKFHTNAQAAVPALIKCLNDQDHRVQSVAVSVLGDLALSPSITIPALTNSLHSGYSDIRASAARGLGKFGTAARPGVSQLQFTLSDPDGRVREEATNAMKKIAPEILTNTNAAGR